jgi:prepilin-type processing-associated H-X9-DG protein
MSLFADHDQQGRLCTGAYDPHRDGCPDTWGWVADMVNTGNGKPSLLLCPSNPLKGCEKLNDLVDNAGTSVSTSWTPDLTRIPAGQCQYLFASTGLWGPNAALTTTQPGATIGDWVQRHFVDKGYNTNYDASWFLVRSGIRTAKGTTTDPATLPIFTDSATPPNPTDKDGMKGLGFTVGPLTRRYLESSWVSGSVIPLLADANLSDPTDSILPVDIAKNPTIGDSYADPAITGNPKADQNDMTSVTTAYAGNNTAESFQDGPATMSVAGGAATNVKIMLLCASNGTNMIPQAKCEQLGSCPAPDGTSYFLQDTRDFGCVHGSGKNLSCNMLMADGSVVEFQDTNGDHYLNPGFQVTAGPGAGTPVTDPTVTGYLDNTIDLPAAQCFSGVFLNGGVSAKPVSFKY